jgi:hypothetical protein
MAKDISMQEMVGKTIASVDVYGSGEYVWIWFDDGTRCGMTLASAVSKQEPEPEVEHTSPDALLKDFQKEQLQALAKQYGVEEGVVFSLYNGYRFDDNVHTTEKSLAFVKRSLAARKGWRTRALYSE